MGEEKILAKEEFESYLNSLGNKMAIIWFSAPWCAPCRRIKATCLDRIDKIENLKSNLTLNMFAPKECMKMFA